MNKPQLMRRASVVGLVVASVLSTSAAMASTIPYTTPTGITLVEVSKISGTASPQLLWRRLGDEHGKPLYTSHADEAGKSNCSGDCAKDFVPFVAKSGAKASGDWTIITRPDHVKQWAYQGKALYTYTGTDPRGEPQGALIELKEDPAWYDPASTVYSPKDGWRRAAYTPGKTAVLPTSVQLATLPVAGGVGLVSPLTHLTVYAAPMSRKLSPDWQPVHAAALAVPIGDFAIGTRKDDSTRQWTFHGEALYTYAGDSVVGEANGLTTGEKDVHVALAYRDFSPNGIQLDQFPGTGPLMTTAKGQTLYTVSRFHATYGGRESIGGYFVSYNELKAQGTMGCEGDCTVTWKPIMAERNAQPSGFWELIARPDGARQWAFKGGPVYTYAGDKQPGDMDGNNRYVVAFGNSKGELAYADAGSAPRDALPPRIGNLTMFAAAGMKPGEKPEYVAGEGHVPLPSEVMRGNASTPTDAKAVDGKDVQLATGNSIRLPDHGAGFYWHMIQPAFE